MNLKTFIGDYCVSTVELPVPHIEGKWETMIFSADNGKISSFDDLWCERYYTEEEARRGHAEACKRLEAGELEVRV